MSADHDRQLQEEILAQRGDCFQEDGARLLDGQRVVLLEEDGPDETDDGILVREDPGDVRPCA